MRSSPRSRRWLAATLTSIGTFAALAPSAVAGPFLAPQRLIDPVLQAGVLDTAVGPGGAAAVVFRAGAGPIDPDTRNVTDTRLWVGIHEQGALPTAALPRGFKLGEAISPAGRAVESAQVGVDAAGTITVVYWLRAGLGSQGTEDGMPIYVRSRPANGSWSAPQLLSTQTFYDDGPNVPPKIVVAPNGRAIILTDAGLFDRTPGQATFTAVAGTGDVKDVAMNAAGNVAALSQVETFNGPGEDQTVTVGARVRPVGGTWGALKGFGQRYRLRPGAYPEDTPSIGITDSGLVAAAWAPLSTGGPQVNVALRTPGSTFASGTWGAPQQVSTQATPDAGASGESILADSATQLTVRWREQEGNGEGTVTVREKLFHGSTPAAAAPLFAENIEAVAVSPAAKGRAIGILADNARTVSLRPKIGDAWSAPQPFITPTSNELYFTGGAGLDDQGNGYVSWTRYYPATATSPARYLVGVTGYDAVSPVLTGVTAGAATAGQPTAFSAKATDRMSAPTLTWTFGDGTTATGAAVSHTYAKAGTYAAKVQARDEAGNTASWPKTIVVAS